MAQFLLWNAKWMRGSWGPRLRWGQEREPKGRPKKRGSGRERWTEGTERGPGVPEPRWRPDLSQRCLGWTAPTGQPGQHGQNRLESQALRVRDHDARPGTQRGDRVWPRPRSEQGPSPALSLPLHHSQAGSEVGVAADEDRGSERPPGLGLRRRHRPSALSWRTGSGGDCCSPPPPPQPCAWARRHCQALTRAVEGPAPSPAPAGFPSPGGGQREGTKVQSLPAQAPTPLPAPGTEGPRPKGAHEQKQPPPLCRHCENRLLPLLRPGVPQF